MDLEKLMKSRRSTRRFLAQPIAEDLLIKIIEMSKWSPSWKNVQPWQLYVVSGDKRDALQQALYQAAFAEERERPDNAYQKKWPTLHKTRMRNLGFGLYNYLGIDKDDLDSRKSNMLENFEFFNAPTVIIVCMPRDFAFWPTLDIGIFLGHLVLAAESVGLATCLQASLTRYPDLVRNVLGISDDIQLVVGLSIGYADKSAEINNFQPQRAPIQEIAHFMC